jgi:hypothetical protein
MDIFVFSHHFKLPYRDLNDDGPHEICGCRILHVARQLFVIGGQSGGAAVTHIAQVWLGGSLIPWGG